MSFDDHGQREAFFSGGGEMGALIQAHDWASTPLGPMTGWPQSLKVAVRLLLNTRHPMFIWWGPELIQFYNDAYAASLGPEKHPCALGARGRDTWPEIWEVIGPQIDQVMSGGEATWHEDQLVPIIRGGGLDEVYWTYGYSPIDDKDSPNGVGGVLVICRETTSEVRARRDTDERYRALFGAVDAGFCIVEVDVEAMGGRADYRVVEANPAFYRQTGFPEAILGHWLREAAPDLEEHWYETYGRVARTGEPARFEQGSGHLGRWFDVYAFPMGEAAQGRVAILFNDISDRRRAEIALRELNEVLEQRVAERTSERDRMWRLSTDIMLVARFDGTIAAVNPAWTSLLGWSETDLVGSRFGDFVHPDDQAATAAEAAKLRDGATTFRFENRYRARDGSFRWLSWTAVPEGELLHAVGRDITAEKGQAQALSHAEEQLRQTQKMEAMGQLTGGVAHDFNNLLTPIIGPLDMIVRRGLGNERERRLLEAALQSAERAKTLVQRLLAFARRQPLQPAAVDIGGLVEGMADLIASTLGPTIDVQVAVDADLPHAHADDNQVEMALLNLSVNARDAMPSGGRLTISAGRVHLDRESPSGLAPGDYVRLSVADTGEGMEETTLNRAVEPFFSTKGIGKGTGLGLSMVHGLAAQLGGGLTIESEPGRGTSVHLWLPVSTGVSQGAEATLRSVAPYAAERGVALVVDDEDLVRMSVAEMLMEIGFAVAEATSGEEALARIRSGAPTDLVVTDHLMPGMSGVDLARAARLERPGLPVLIISGYADVEAIAPGLPRLTKPFRPAELAEQVIKLMPAPTSS